MSGSSARRTPLAVQAQFLDLFRAELLEAQEVVAYIAMRASQQAVPPREPSLIEVPPPPAPNTFLRDRMLQHQLRVA